MTLHCKLETVLKEKGISKSELSRQTGIDASFISRLANNKRQPTIEYVIRILQALKIDLYDLYDIKN